MPLHHLIRRKRDHLSVKVMPVATLLINGGNSRKGSRITIQFRVRIIAKARQNRFSSPACFHAAASTAFDAKPHPLVIVIVARATHEIVTARPGDEKQ